MKTLTWGNWRYNPSLPPSLDFVPCQYEVVLDRIDTEAKLGNWLLHFADKQWAPQLIPALRAELPALSNARGAMKDRRTTIIRALASLGDLEFVKSLLADGSKDGELLRRRIESDMKGHRGAHALCY